MRWCLIYRFIFRYIWHSWRLNIVQLVYIRHFQNPLTILWADHTLGAQSKAAKKKLAKDAGGFLRDLRKSLGLDDTENIEEVMNSARKATTQLRQALREAVYAFRILREVQSYLRSLSTQQHAMELSASFVRMAKQFGDGKLDDMCSRLVKRVR